MTQIIQAHASYTDKKSSTRVISFRLSIFKSFTFVTLRLAVVSIILTEII